MGASLEPSGGWLGVGPANPIISQRAVPLDGVVRRVVAACVSRIPRTLLGGARRGRAEAGRWCFVAAPGFVLGADRAYRCGGSRRGGAEHLFPIAAAKRDDLKLPVIPLNGEHLLARPYVQPVRQDLGRLL